MDVIDNNEDVASGKGSRKRPYLIIGLVLIISAAVIWFIVAGSADKKSSDKSTESTSATSTKESASNTAQSDEPIYSATENQWSKMNEGPYKDKVSYATSNDLLHWTDSGKILTDHTSVPDAVVKDGVIYSYFVDVSTDGYPEKVGLIKSTDNGASWTSREFITIKGMGQKAPADPSPILLDNGQIRLFYFDILEGRNAKGKKITNKIYSAVSSDGINFTQEDGVRFEYNGIFDPCVVRVLTADSTSAGQAVWHMYVGNMEGNKVFSATSTDGMTFSYEGVALTGGAIPKVVFDNNKYYLFTGGIEISTSTDGKTFTKTSNRFSNGKLTADPGVVKLSDGSYLMVYKTREMNDTVTPKP